MYNNIYTCTIFYLLILLLFYIVQIIKFYLLIVNLKYIDSSKMSIFDSSNNYTFLSDLYRTIFFISPKNQFKKSHMFLFKY